MRRRVAVEVYRLFKGVRLTCLEVVITAAAMAASVNPLSVLAVPGALEEFGETVERTLSTC
jgi:hypothetical protein